LSKTGQGRLLKAGAENYDNMSILVAEARTIYDGLNLAIQVGYDKSIVKGDNKIAIQAIKGNFNPMKDILYHLRHLQMEESRYLNYRKPCLPRSQPGS